MFSTTYQRVLAFVSVVLFALGIGIFVGGWLEMRVTTGRLPVGVRIIEYVASAETGRCLAKIWLGNEPSPHVVNIDDECQTVVLGQILTK